MSHPVSTLAADPGTAASPGTRTGTPTDAPRTGTSPGAAPGRRSVPPRPDDVVVLVGNPRPGSRTRAAAEAVGRAVVAHQHLGTVRTIDLADLAGELLLPDAPRVDEALGTLAAARFAVVATPVYKASYTGLLKAFLDRYGHRGLTGVTVVPLVVSASAGHARAGDDHLVPLLVELGAQVPDGALALLEEDLPDVDALADRWVARWLDSLVEVAR